MAGISWRQGPPVAQASITLLSPPWFLDRCLCLQHRVCPLHNTINKSAGFQAMQDILHSTKKCTINKQRVLSMKFLIFSLHDIDSSQGPRAKAYYKLCQEQFRVPLHSEAALEIIQLHLYTLTGMARSSYKILRGKYIHIQQVTRILYISLAFHIL